MHVTQCNKANVARLPIENKFLLWYHSITRDSGDYCPTDSKRDTFVQLHTTFFFHPLRTAPLPGTSCWSLGCGHYCVDTVVRSCTKRHWDILSVGKSYSISFHMSDTNWEQLYNLKWKSWKTKNISVFFKAAEIVTFTPIHYFEFLCYIWLFF